MYIATGTSEVLQSDAATLVENAKKAGIDVQVELPRDMQHIWVALAGNALEADQTLLEAASFISTRLGS